MRYPSTIVAVLFFLTPSLVYCDYRSCAEAINRGRDAYHFARKASTEESFEKALTYAEKAEKAAEKAKSSAGDCDCDKAEDAFDEAKEYAESAREADSQSELYENARKAMREAKQGVARAKRCR